MAVNSDLQRFSQAGSPPRPTKEVARTLVNNVLSTAANQASDVLDVRSARRVTVLVDMDAGSANNQLRILPLMSYDALASVPLATDDVWFIPCVTDGAVTSVVPGGTGLAGADFTLASPFYRVDLRPIELRLPGEADAASFEGRFSFELDVTAAQYLHLQWADVDSSAGTLSTVTMKAVRSV